MQPWIPASSPVAPATKWLPTLTPQDVDPGGSHWTGAGFLGLVFEGWWDGTVVQPATMEGWWDGASTQPVV